MWNHVYGNSEAIPYPEVLKEVLVALGASVDVARPRLEILNYESNAHFNFESPEEDANTTIVTPARIEANLRYRPSTSRTTASSSLSKVVQVAHSSPLTRIKSKGRTPKPKPRHEDSQVQFEAIDSSPASAEYESQLLTERQKETRERQRDTAALFPEMRSSPSTATRKARAGAGQHELLTESAVPAPGRASTPEHEDTFEDYLTSTPTPRRGQPMMLPVQDQELSTDPPSSPPEPRCYRLMAELKTQANNANSLDDWRFSSSPVTGSPNPAQVTNSTSQPMELDDVSEDLQLDNEANVTGRTVEQNGVKSSHLSVDPEVIEETTYFHEEPETDLPAGAPIEQGRFKSPATPSGRVLRSKALQATPKSDNDEFVDAPSSPLPPTPSQRLRPESSHVVLRKSPRGKGNSQSFSVSDSFENGMRNLGTGRFEIEIRSSPKKKDVPSYDDIPPESPEHSGEGEKAQGAGKAAEEPTEETAKGMGCITVEGAAPTQLRRGRSKKTRPEPVSRQSQTPRDARESSSSQASVGRPRTPVAQLAMASLQEGFENVSPGSGTWIRKRKRSVSMHSSGDRKRGRQDPVLKDTEDEIPDSQPAAVAKQGMLSHFVQWKCLQFQSLTFDITGRDVEMRTSKLYEPDVSLISGLDPRSSPSEPWASQELPPGSSARPDQPQPDSDKQTNESSEHTDDEELVQSQLAREENEASTEREVTTLQNKVACTQLEAELVAQFEEPAEHTQQAAPHEENMAQRQPVQGGGSKFDRLRLLLQDGLGLLKSANLTRDETNQLEDIFMDMKQELYQAERRGRK
jgi:hypothetical protein